MNSISGCVNYLLCDPGVCVMFSETLFGESNACSVSGVEMLKARHSYCKGAHLLACRQLPIASICNSARRLSLNTKAFLSCASISLVLSQNIGQIISNTWCLKV